MAVTVVAAAATTKAAVAAAMAAGTGAAEQATLHRRSMASRGKCTVVVAGMCSLMAGRGGQLLPPCPQLGTGTVLD